MWTGHSVEQGSAYAPWGEDKSPVRHDGSRAVVTTTHPSYSTGYGGVSQVETRLRSRNTGLGHLADIQYLVQLLCR